MDRPTNILFLLFDCLRSRALFDPSRGASIPTIEQLVTDGVGFPTCIATTTTTSPSMATLFTGVLPFVHGVRSLHSHKLESNIPTLAEVLSRNGFLTIAETTGPVLEFKGFDRGFSRFRHRSPRQSIHSEKFWSELQLLMQELPKDRPWFLYLHLWEMHWPRQLPASFDHRRFGAHRYERALSAIDALRLPRILELAGDDTLIVLTGDHGEIPRLDRTQKVGRRLHLKPVTHFVGERAGHSFHVYEDLVRVPLVLHGPGVPPRGRIETAVRHMDVFPTLLDMAGVEDPSLEHVQGRSVTPLFDGAGEDRPGYSEAVKVGWDEGRWLTSVRHDGWKYVKRASGGDRWLWRLPDEHKNRLAEHPEVVQRLDGILADMQRDRSLLAHGDDLTPEESSEMERHLRNLGYLD
jgi:arylsulfatase A-like enzyme